MDPAAVAVIAVAVITAISGLFIAMAGVATALVSLIPVLRRIKKIDAGQGQITDLVNGSHNALLTRIEQLSTTMAAAGVEVPADPALTPPPGVTR